MTATATLATGATLVITPMRTVTVAGQVINLGAAVRPSLLDRAKSIFSGSSSRRRCGSPARPECPGQAATAGPLGGQPVRSVRGCRLLACRQIGSPMMAMGITKSRRRSKVMGSPIWKSHPSWYMIASNDEAIPPEAERQFATRMQAVTTEVPSSHVAMVPQPDEVTRFIATAAPEAPAAM